MLRQDLELFFIEIMLPGLEYMNYCSKLQSKLQDMSWVVLLMDLKLSKPKSNHSSLLRQNTSKSFP